MATNDKYEIWLTSDTGLQLATLNSFTRLEASRVVNGIGNFSLYMPLSFDPNLIAPDRMVQIWRRPTGGTKSLWRVYFLRRWKFSTEGSKQVIELGGPDTNDLLRRRIVAAYAGSPQASKTDFADDMLKEVVTESIADGVDPTPTAGTRVWSNLSITADTSLGPSISREFAYGRLLATSNTGVLSIIAKAARTAGAEVFFDIVPDVVSTTSITFKFITTINQPGADVSSKVVFDQGRGNMKDPSLEYDYTQEENYIYAAGQGEGALRNVQQVYDADRYNVSIWGRCEGFADARQQTSDDGVIDVGNTALDEGRPRIRFSAKPVDTNGTRYGIDWNLGDKVQSKYLNRQFYCIIRADAISVDSSGENISARLDYEGLL